MFTEEKRKYILQIEDNPDDVLLTRLAFKKSQIPNKLIVVCDGEEALDYIFRRGQYAKRATDDNPAVILLDLKLPKVDGLEVLKQIREGKSTHDIPVIVLTSSIEVRDQRVSTRLGISSYLQKPTGLSRFTEMIQQINMQFLN
jgi:two-component system response regulator